MKKTRTYSDYYGYVYLLKCGDLYKIGQSATPYRRVKQFRTASPHPIELVHTLPRSILYKHIEKQLHWRFRDKRRSGEWFALDGADVDLIKSLNDIGRTPDEQKKYDQQDAAYHAARHSERQAEEDRQLAVLLSGAAAGVGDFCWIG